METTVAPVPLLDLKAQYATIRDEVQAALASVVDAQAFILGPAVERFEREAAAYLGAGHAIGCASGTDALILGLASLDVGPGDEVLTSPFSFFASASCAYKVGARPRFADVDPVTWNLDPEKVEAALTPRTKALVPVHLYGQCADLDALAGIARRRGIGMVEDACQAFGATWTGADGVPRRAGTVGEAGAFSFFPSKNLGGFGDGGLVVTQDPDRAARLGRLRVHGSQNRYYHLEVGWNSRLDSLQAAVLTVKLKRLDAWCAGRERVAARYAQLFEQAGLVSAGRIAPPARAPRTTHIWHQYTVRAQRRDALVEHLKARGIGHAIYYPVPLHLQDCFRELGYREGDFPVSEKAAREVVSLPIYAELAPAQQDRVVGEIADFYRAG